MAKSKKTQTTREAVQVEADAPAPAATIEPVQLTVGDLQLLARIVDLASRRGAFQANELSQVGEAYNKLAGFLAYVDSVQNKDSESGAQSTEPTAEQAG